MLDVIVNIEEKNTVEESDVKIKSYEELDNKRQLKLNLRTPFYDKFCKKMTVGIDDAKKIIDTINKFREDNEEVSCNVLALGACFKEDNTLYLNNYILNMRTRFLAEGYDTDIRYYKYITEENDRLLQIYVEMINIIKEYGSKPSNRFRLEDLFNKIIESDNDKLTCKIIEHDELVENGYTLITAVGNGNKSSKICHISYRGDDKSNKTFVIIGKGVNFDTGGYSLKPNDSMITMSKDKIGAVTALAIVKFLNKIKPEINVDIITGWAENLIDANSYKPGDVITSKFGIDVEIVNTDAEGRLVLADCIEYMKEELYGKMEISNVVTIATLTGGAVRAGGFKSTVLVGYRDNHMMYDYTNSSAAFEEDTLLLHYTKEVANKIKSKIADIKNAGDDKLSAQTGGYFINRFLPNDLQRKHLHLDIAGSGFTTEGYLFNEYGPTGVVIRPLTYILKEIKY